jgi:hypothetical protein
MALLQELPLIKLESGKFTPGQRAMDELNERRAVCDQRFLAVCGTARRGKSTRLTLLGRHLGIMSDSEGFRVEPGPDTVTKGVRFWPKPYLAHECNCDWYLLDIMGFNDVASTQETDQKLLSLVALLCDVVVLQARDVWPTSTVAVWSQTTVMRRWSRTSMRARSPTFARLPRHFGALGARCVGCF